MAAGTLAAPGTEFGPCEDVCQHTDCASTRRMAAVRCIRCGNPIGYGTPFFQVEGESPVEAYRWEDTMGQVWALTHAECEYATAAKAARSRIAHEDVFGS